MRTQTIALTPTEAAIIAQRAFMERIEGRPGIWSRLQERVRSEKVPGVSDVPVNAIRASDWAV